MVADNTPRLELISPVLGWDCAECRIGVNQVISADSSQSGSHTRCTQVKTESTVFTATTQLQKRERQLGIPSAQHMHELPHGGSRRQSKLARKRLLRFTRQLDGMQTKADMYIEGYEHEADRVGPHT